MYVDKYTPRSTVTTISPYWKTIAGNLAISYTTITDAGSGLYNVTLYYRYSNDNVSFGGWVASNVDSDPWKTQSWSFNFANGSGFYEYYSRARDNATNFEDAPVGADTKAGYDVVNPTATITIPANGGFYRTGSAIDINITGTANDAEGILKVNLTIYNSTGHKYWNTSQGRWVAYAIGVGNITVNLTGSGATRGWYFSNPHRYPTWLTANVYVINASAKDGAGNWEVAADSNSFTYDTNNPSSTIDIPVVASWYRTLTNVSGTGLDTGGSGLNLVNITLYNSTSKKYWNGTTWSAVVVNFTATGTSTWYKNSGLPSVWVNGSTYIINATAKDNAGNVGEKHSHTFYMDLATPGSQVTAISGYWKTSTPQTISYTANNSGSGLYYVKLYYQYATDNTTWGGWTSNNNDTDPWITKTWNFAFTNGSGKYQFYSRAADNVSNLEAAPGVKDAYCGYDEYNPTVTITVPVNGSHYNTMGTISGTCADTGYSGIKSVNLTLYNTTAHKYWNGSSNAWESGVRWVSSAIAAGYVSWSYNSNLVTWKDHITYWVNATSKDNATRTSTAHWHTFTFDTTSPTCAIAYNISRNYYQDADSVKIYANFTTPAGMNENTVRINLTYADATYTNTTLTRVNNTRWYYSWNVPAGAAKDGIVTVKIFAWDNASNPLNPYPTSSTTKRIDNTVPISQATAIATYWKTSSLLTIATTASDVGSGLASVTLYYYYSAVNSSFAGPTSIGTNTSPWIGGGGISWSFTFPSDGFYRFYTRATDNVSNSEAAPVANDTLCGYDHTAPVSSVDAITPYWKNTKPLTITATATDATSGVKNVTFYYRYTATNSSWGNWVNNGTDTTPSPWSRVMTFGNGTGYYQFYSRAADNATNTEAVPGGTPDAICGYDFTAPTTTVSTISPYWRTTGTTITATVSNNNMSGIDTITLYCRNSTDNSTWSNPWIFGTADTDPWVSAQWTFTFPNDTGYYRFYSRGTDNATNTETLPGVGSPDALCGYDYTRPVCTIQYNRSATYFKAGTALKIWVNFTEATSGINPSSVMMNITTQGLINDTHNTSLTQTNNLHWYENWVVPSGSNDGAFTVKIYASDNATNLLNPYPITNNAKKIDNTAPTCTIGYNNSRTYFKAGEALKIYANFTEVTSGINESSVIINISTIGNGDLSNVSMTKTNNTHWYYNWIIPSGSDDDGAFTVKIYAKDNATNNLNPSPTFNNSKTIDNTAPSISSISAGSITTSSATIIWTTNEDATSSVEYGTTISYGLFSNSSTYTTSPSCPLSGLSASTTYNYRVISYDRAGNENTSSDNTFTTSSAPGPGPGPGPSGNAPTADAGGPYTAYTNEAITFNASGSTDDIGITGYRWDWENDGTYDTAWITTKTTTHTYTAVGIYTVKLEVKDSGSLTDTDTATVTITELPVEQHPPVARTNGPYTGLTFQNIRRIRKHR